MTHPQLPDPADLRPPTHPDEDYWRGVRRWFDPAGIDGYMNNGSLGPMPQPVVAAIADQAARLAANASDHELFALREGVREQLAAFVGTQADEIALTRSTTEGMNLLAHGLDWRAGDEVILSSFEHPGAADAYRGLAARHGVVLRYIELPRSAAGTDAILQRYREAIGPRTRLIVASHIVYVTGRVMPIAALAELAHQHGLLLSVDGAHAPGMLPLDLQALGCDHYAASGQKWLLGGTGTGLCYLRPQLLQRVWPLMGYRDPERQDPHRAGARRYEQTGQKNLPAIAGIGAALRFANTIGRDTIARRVTALATRLRDSLATIDGVTLWTPTEAGANAGLTSFSVGLIPNTTVTRELLAQAGVYVIPMPVGGLNAVRVSTHFYNTPEQVDAVLRVARELADNELDYA